MCKLIKKIHNLILLPIYHQNKRFFIFRKIFLVAQLLIKGPVYVGPSVIAIDYKLFGSWKENEVAGFVAFSQ